MADKVFGLNEAQKIAARKNVSVPTIKAMLDILGIPNVVGQQVKAAIVACDKAINAALTTVGDAKRRKESETVRINKAIEALNQELTAIVATTAGVEKSQSKVVKLTENEIANLMKLAKKFS